MSKENVEVVDQFYEAWNDDDFEAARPVLHPDVDWHTSGQFPGVALHYHGIEGVREWWTALKEPWHNFTIQIEDTREEENRVLREVRFKALGKGSGVRVELPFVHVWEVTNGLIVRYSAHPSLEEALEAVGLSDNPD